MTDDITAKVKTKTKVMVAGALILVTAVFFGGHYMLREMQLNRLESRALEAYEAERYKAATRLGEELLGRLRNKESGRAQRIRHHLALCCVEQAENQTEFFRRVAYYQKARQYDASVVDNEVINQLIEQGDIGLPGEM